MKKDEKLVLWTERLKAFQASGQTCKEWCQEHQIPVSTMTYWNRKLRAMENSSQPELIFAKMPTEQELPAGASAHSYKKPERECLNWQGVPPYILHAESQIFEKVIMAWQLLSN